MYRIFDVSLYTARYSAIHLLYHTRYKQYIYAHVVTEPQRAIQRYSTIQRYIYTTRYNVSAVSPPLRLVFRRARNFYHLIDSAVTTNFYCFNMSLKWPLLPIFFPFPPNFAQRALRARRANPREQAQGTHNTHVQAPQSARVHTCTHHPHSTPHTTLQPTRPPTAQSCSSHQQLQP